MAMYFNIYFEKKVFDKLISDWLENKSFQKILGRPCPVYVCYILLLSSVLITFTYALIGFDFLTRKLFYSSRELIR